MERVKPFDWHRIFFGDEQAYLFMLEIGFRVIFIYVFTIALMRFMGKRGNRSLSVFENVLIIALGSSTGDAMFYPNVPLFYACIVITIIVALTRILQEWQLRSKTVNTFLDGYPIMLIKDGKIREEGLVKSRVRKDEFLGMLRNEGIRNLGEVEYAFFERTGDVGIFKFEEKKFDGETTFPENIDKD